MTDDRIELQSQALEAWKNHVHDAHPFEACGVLVVRKGRQIYWPCQNIAESKHHQFHLKPEDWSSAEDAGEIVAVLHSHPNASANPSEADRVGCESSKLPWLIMGWPSGVIKELFPSGWKAPLIGRSYFYGVLDCYSLCRDYYAERGIQLPDYERAEDWWKKGQNLYTDNFKEAGFKEIEKAQLKEGDIILMNMMADRPNHAAIYLGSNMILHHVQGRLSCREIFTSYYQKISTHFLRHCDVD